MRSKRQTAKIKSWERSRCRSQIGQKTTDLGHRYCPAYRLKWGVHSCFGWFLWKTRFKLGMVKLRLYVARVKTPVLHIVVQLLIRGDSWPKRHLTKVPEWACSGACLDQLWDGNSSPSPGWKTGWTGRFESTGDERQGQFNKSGATVEMVLGKREGCGKSGRWTVDGGQ